MNRIEEIKEHVEHLKKYGNGTSEEDYYTDVQIAADDIEHLLSKLEVATKALEQINEMGYNELVCADHNALINKALQQIKEPG